MSEVETDKKANAPPEVITVDTVSKDIATDATPTKGDSASQARTPKHANKSKDDETRSLGDPENISSQHQRIPPSHAHGAWNGPPPQVFQSSSYPPHFDQQRQGAFQPHDRHSFPPNQGHPPMQVSPGGGRYYYTSNGPNRYTSSYDPRYAADFSQAPSYPHQRTYGGPPPLYSQQYPGGGYEGRPSASWGLPPSFPHGRPPHQHIMNHPEHFNRRAPMINKEGGSNVNFSRAVSSSFDRSIKSAPDKSHHRMEHSPKLSAVAHSQPDSGSYSEDASWGALQQVHSVDEDEMRKRLSKRKVRDASNDVIVNQPASNSSSLTNSPTDGVEGKEKHAPAVKPSSLDSLSSVASAQEPLDTKEESKAHSPDRSTPSLDLMKCPSGSSALLLPSHQRSFSQLSTGMESKGSTKRDYDADEERDGTVETSKDDAKGKSDEPISKKSRKESEGKKSSPLSITCSPPTTPGAKKRRDAKMHQPHALYPHRKDESPAFYDKAPSYAYSIESGAHMPRDTLPDSYATVPRPGSSASSTMTPMNVDGPDIRHPPGVGQIPSWEIHAQDSFGATSVNGGNPLMGSFSFQQEYQMLAPSASGDLGQMHGHPMHPHQAMESRNQSFEGGHYHGGFTRSDSMMSYEGRQMSFDGHGRTVYQGQFPPHAPSWGSAGSYPAGYVQQRMGYPPMMRNFSEDSGARTSPPPGSANMRMMPPNFPPPPEFRAPPSMVNKGGPQNTIMTSSYPSSPKGGPFGWSKEEDSRLTEIMKKYKNPRDWEPISKEHNRGRTAKECHERWIRYLKPGVRKGQWTDHEDAVVMEVVTTSNEQPFTRWSDLAQRLPGRVGKQIRDRWVNHLNPAINHLPFSREDDLNLWEGHKELGKRWVEISTKHFNNTRSENHIKNRWYSASFKKFISNEFGPEAYNGGKSPSSVNDSPTKKESPKKKVTRRPLTLDPSQVEAV